MTDLSRRALLLASSALLALTSGRLLAAPSRHRALGQLVAAADSRDGSHHLAWLDPADDRPHALATQFRGHGAAAHPSRPHVAVMFARRPGTLACAVDLRAGRIDATFQASPKRHFYGHGCFSADGRYLFTTENDFIHQRGVIGVRDGRSYQHLDEFPSGGIGPHDMALLPDGNTLAVANGGIFTHPDSGRLKLNLATMAPRLSYIDLATRQVVADYAPSERHASTRHLATAGEWVAIAMQFQRAAAGHDRPVPLLALQRGGGEWRYLAAPAALLRRFDDYAGSVAIAPQAGVVGITSPRGDTAGFWRLASGELLGLITMPRVCGLAVSLDERYFVLSNALGELRFIEPHNLAEATHLRVKTPRLMWDNHLALFAT